jgi:hypothetical protein
MHPTTSRLMYAFLGAAALGISAVNPAPATADTPLGIWLKSTPHRTLAPCASATAASETAQAPWFTFNGAHYYDCLIDGPYTWNDKQWYVLRISQFVPPVSPAPPPVDLVRVCSLQAAHPPGPFVEGPCHSTNGVGPAGCEVCQ